MKRWVIENFSKKKVRGLKRRCRTFIKYLDEKTDSLPIPKNCDPNYQGYSALSLSFEDFFTDSQKIPNSVRKLFVQTIINRTIHLINSKTGLQREYRIFCIISSRGLMSAHIAVLYTKKGLESFYKGLFSREEESVGAQLTAFSPENVSEWGLIVPAELDVKGYKFYGDFSQDGIILIGELD
ncbi:DUF3916 domain-containing protein [Neobacillus pocheonensis]|uniref:DUF3916 domain-containing protein n=1 Tax=Neobacillus pocheonensis TaxID=363869 RepID=UPI003D268697